MQKTYFVYMMANHTQMLYIGVTNSLERRVLEHKAKAADAYTKRYDMRRLVYFEDFADIRDAIAREKQLKSWRRAREIELVRTMNPRWRDLAADWE
jgi:putative endonuclease